MRIPSVLLLSLCAITALAQNSAPVSHDTTVHVPPARAAKAASDANAAASTEKQSGQAPSNQSEVLDSVIGIINGDVLLQSDVAQERRFESLQLLPADQNTDVHAADALITRTLILQQMKEEGQNAVAVSDAELDKAIAELKSQLPGCAANRCASVAGWADFLSAHALTSDEVRNHWRQRLVILNYLNLRFRTGIRVPDAQAKAYYEQNLAPKFTAKNQKPPAFKSLEPRIKEVLLQQQVSKQIDEWEALLRQEGTVQILVPAYGQSSAGEEESSDAPGGGL